MSPTDTPGPDGSSSGLPGTPGPVWPEQHYEVGVRSIALSRGAHRPLTTLIFYPTVPGPDGTSNPNSSAAAGSGTESSPAQNSTESSPAGSGTASSSAQSETKSSSAQSETKSSSAQRGTRNSQGIVAAKRSTRFKQTRRDAQPAFGRFPLVLFSHGLRGSPTRYSAALVSWAAAGFVVAAPSYPHTSEESTRFDRADIVHQPADALFVLRHVRALDATPGDPLAGHIDVERVAAVGHSAGGYTTTGLFAAGHPEWLRAGVVLAGWLAPGAFGGPPAPMLYLQGARDTVVPVALGRAAYEATPWWRSYVLLPASWHADYMVPSGKDYPMMDVTVTDFLRWTLKGDEAAHIRLPPSSFPVGRAE